MRCPDCNKFVSVESDIISDNAEIGIVDDKEGFINICYNVVVSLMCDECGAELASYEFYSDAEAVEFDVKLLPEDAAEREAWLERIDLTNLDTTASSDKRFKKYSYGFVMEYDIVLLPKKDKDGAILEPLLVFKHVEISDQVEASEFEVL